MSDADLAERVATLGLAVGDPDAGVCWNAARELAKLGPLARAALPRLIVALRSHDATTVVWARFAIARITGDSARHLPALIRALDDRRVYPGMASFALAELGEAASDAVPALIPQLGDPNAENRWSAAGALARIGKSASPAVPALRDALRDPDEKVRWYAAWALGEIGTGSTEAIPDLIQALTDFDDDVRGYAARALGRVGSRSPETVAALTALLEDDNEAVREVARTALTLLQG